MHVVLSFIAVCTLSLILATTSAEILSNCKHCFIISWEIGNDSSCAVENASSVTPCKTISHVLQLGNDSLSNREVFLQGDHWINETLTVSHVDGLTVRGNDSTIYCREPSSHNDTGSGLVFQSVTNLKVINVNFQGCGTLQYSTVIRNSDVVKIRSTIYIVESTNIHINSSSFFRSVGRGLSMYAVNGLIVIERTDFVENMVPMNEQNKLSGGGGIHIEFTHCSPGFLHCRPTDNVQKINGEYSITHCNFKGNKATNKDSDSIIQYKVSEENNGNSAAQGSGIDILYSGVSFNSIVKINNCTFFNNSAENGGSISAIFMEYGHNNTVSINGCVFHSNHALTGGGALLVIIAQFTLHKVAYNRITVSDSVFINNSAGWGGAIALASRSSTLELNMVFINCSWIKNVASFGAAVAQLNGRLSIFDGEGLMMSFNKCSFHGNIVTNTAAFLKTSIDGNSHHVLESGVLDILSAHVQFKDKNSFIGNTGSAIFAESAQIDVLSNSLIHFENNTASKGGAMALLGFTTLELHSGSQIVFQSNHASELGGAVYAISPHQADFIFSHRCFFSQYSLNLYYPSKWNTSLIFIRNTALYGYSVYADSLLPCVKQVGGNVTNVSEFFQERIFEFNPEIKKYTIATSPATIDFVLPVHISPGERINLNLMSMDDLGQRIPSAFKVTLDSLGGDARTNPYVSDDGYIQIWGEPGTEFQLTLQTQNTRHVAATGAGTLGECPLGFVLGNDSCICSANTTDKQFVGIPECDMTQFKAFLHVGCWLGCIDNNTTVTSFCPSGYCKYDNGAISYVGIPRSCDLLKEHTLCVDLRRGQLCGQCEEGYTVYYHSDNFLCGKCSYGAAGLVMYIISELIPLALLFAFIMIMKTKLTSGLMQCILLFSQTLIFINSVPSLVPLSTISHAFVRTHTFLIGFLNLDFFRLDELSFCLWSVATVLDNLAFRYVTTLFSIILLGTFIFMVKRQIRCTPIKDHIKKKIPKVIARMKIFNNPIVHGISTFLIISYTQYTVTSFQILSRLPLYGEGGKTHHYVVRLQGNVDYFGEEHLPYAIPAVLVLLVLSVPPPLLLISYPLLWNIKAKLRHNVGSENDTTIWPIRKLLPLIDSFQGVFRDNRRMFAGLLFLWRLIIAAIFAFSTTSTEFYLLIEIAILAIFTIHAVARPYKQRLYNMIDAVMFANLAIINALSWYNSSQPVELKYITGIKILLMYLPLLCLTSLAILWLLHKCGVLPKWIQLPTSEENEPTSPQSYVTSSLAGERNLKAGRCMDEDLFSRAAEINHPPSLILSACETGFQLQTTLNSDTST